jgi:hypothetical protein
MIIEGSNQNVANIRKKFIDFMQDESKTTSNYLKECAEANVFVKHKISMKKLEFLNVLIPKVKLTINKCSIIANIDT